MEKIIQHWPILVDQVEKVTDRVWKVNDHMVLKKYEDQHNAEKNIAIIKSLDGIGFQVPQILESKQSRTYIYHNQAYYMMMELIDGHHLTNQEVILSKDLAFKIGQTVAKLQIGLKKVENDYDFYDNNFMDELNGWVSERLNQTQENYFVKDQLKTVIESLSTIYPELIRQPIHRDVHLGNMLFKDHEVSGFIDFDLGQKNARIFDLAYLCIGALAENFEDQVIRNAWGQYLEDIVKGYNSIEKLTAVEENSLLLMMAGIEALFVAFFIQKNNEKLAKSADQVFEWLWTNML